jgi:hypothetical protein
MYRMPHRNPRRSCRRSPSRMFDLRHCAHEGESVVRTRSAGVAWPAAMASHQLSSHSLPPSRRPTPQLPPLQLPPLVAAASAVAPSRGASSGSSQPLARESSTRWESKRRACFDTRRLAQFGCWTRRPGRRDGSCGRRRVTVCQAAFLATAVASTSADSAGTCAKPRSRRRLRRCLGPCRVQRQ